MGERRELRRGEGGMGARQWRVIRQGDWWGLEVIMGATGWKRSKGGE